MQCQSQLNQSSLVTALGIKASIAAKNTAWFAKNHILESDEECMEPFPDIDSMTIERFYNNYKNSNGLKIYNTVILGIYTVDIKKRLKYSTDDPNNCESNFLVLRGLSHKCERPESSRFVAGRESDSFIIRSITDYDHGWLGWTWFKNNNSRLRSQNQIEKGLVDEAIV